MANVITNNSMVHGGAAVTNWISQINVGSSVYDLATHHSITFKEGQNGTGTAWNGLSDLTVVIPTLADLVTNPIEFVGTYDTNGFDYVYELGNNYTPNKGDLVYIKADCSFPATADNTVACEAGDMAVYDGTKWCVVSGENQVTILNVDSSTSKANVVLNGSAKDVLTVEGKTLALSVDYTGISGVLKLEKNETITLNVTNGTITVPGMYVGLSYAGKSEKTIGEATSISLPTALANGEVTISDKVLVSSNFTFGAGALPVASMNSASISVAVTDNKSLATGTESSTSGAFVASIDGALKSVSVVDTDDVLTATWGYVSEVSLIDSKTETYISRIRTATSTETADFTIPGKPSVSGTKTFATGFTSASKTGDVLSSVAVGAVSFDSTKNDFVTGLSSNESGEKSGNVITKVSFGALETTSGDWFVTGISGATQVVTGVEIGATTLVSATTSAFTQSAVTSASVSNHVLSFNTGDFMKPVEISKATDTITKSTLTKGSVRLSGYGVSSAAFNKGGISQADTTVSYKSLMTASFDLSFADDTPYKFDSKAVKELDATTTYKKLDTVSASIMKNSYSLTGTISAVIPSNSVMTGIYAGELPSLAIAAPSGTIGGSVSTALTTSEVSWYAVKSDATSIDIPGAYSLVSTSDANKGAIAVATSGNYALNEGIVTIASEAFVTEVYVSDTAINVKK